MRPVITVTLNPALDLAVSTPRVMAGPKLRCSAPQVDPGGGGINVARVIAELGGICRAIVAIGGTTGQELLARLEAQKLPTHAIEINGATRQSLSVLDEGSKEQFRFVMPGPIWDKITVDRFLSEISPATPENALVVLSGSLPPGVAADFPARLVQAMRGRKVFMDLSGSALVRMASGGSPKPALLRMDQEESETLHGSPLPALKDTAAFAKRLVDHGAAETVIIARGAEGSVMANAQGAWFSSAAKVEVSSKVGAGDSFVGGYAFALADGQSPQEALRLGAAAASAAVTTPATELCHKAKVMELLAQCRITELEL